MRVLLVTHEASRTGAPRVAVMVAKALVGQGHHVEVVSRVRGPLADDFSAVAPTSIEFLYRVRRRLWNVRRLGVVAWLVDTALVTLTLLRRRPDVVYVNSTAAAVYLRPARLIARFTVLHVHESGQLSQQFLRRARVPARLEGVTIVACSPSVQADLSAITGRAETDITMLASVPDDVEVMRLSAEPPEYRYSSEELIVGCCGAVEHRKGPDLWVTVAAEVLRALPDQRVRFVWVGEVIEPVEEAERLPHVEFLGPSANPYPHMRRFDLATLPSRDDPFPLVVLESMLLGTPVVAFAVGGVREQIGDAGILVAPGDAMAFAREIVALLQNADVRHRLGTAAQQRVQGRYSTDSFASGLSALMGAMAAPP